MSDFIDNSAVSESSPIADTSPGDVSFPVDDPSPFPEAADSAVSEVTPGNTRADETPSAESEPVTSSLPTLTERGELRIVIISPDGTMTYYDEGGNLTAEVADTAYSLWLSENAALEKPFANYSVSEALLLFIAIGSVIGLISKVFKRRKL